ARNVDFYNLDAIISVGYRVNSVRATQFRQWATQVLKEFAIKGYALDKKRMENGTFLGEDYFERLLEEVREIRLSEIPMTMEDWAKRLDMFLEFDDREVLQDAGRVTAKLAKKHAVCEFEKYRIVQDRLFESDFDRVLKQLDQKDIG
ncbi:MAG: virulence protein, partial [Candidatus Electrothrix sp. ATG2]|nr:virulence protein [Candidatus Electrothrix sp. ATG2]